MAEWLVSGGLLPDEEHQANGRYGREARIGDPAAFKVEQPVEWPQPEQTDSPVVADWVSWQARPKAGLRDLATQSDSINQRRSLKWNPINLGSPGIKVN